LNFTFFPLFVLEYT